MIVEAARQPSLVVAPAPGRRERAWRGGGVAQAHQGDGAECGQWFRWQR